MNAAGVVLVLTLEAFVLERLVAPLRATLLGVAEEARNNREGMKQSVS